MLSSPPAAATPPSEPSHRRHSEAQQQRSAPSSPPASDFTPPGSRTPTGYQTSAPSSHEGSPIPRKQIRRSAREVPAGGMVQTDRGEATMSNVMWRPQPDNVERVVPPWAEADAQAPPPPSQMHNTFSPTSQRRHIKPVAPTSSAVESSPSPKHFNRPAPGASPVQARRSLFRNNAASRARSVDSIARSPPWAEHKLRRTPKTGSPLTNSEKIKSTSSTDLEKTSEFTAVSSAQQQEVTVKMKEQLSQDSEALSHAGQQSAGYQATERIIPISREYSEEPQQPSFTMMGTKPVTESQQSSPTPWRKNVTGRATSANVTPTHQQPAPPPCGSPPFISAAPDTVHATTGIASAPVTQQAPWRRGTAEVSQQAQSPAKPATTTPELISQNVTVDSQPSWRKQRPKTRSSATPGTTVHAAAAAQPSVSSSVASPATAFNTTATAATVPSQTGGKPTAQETDVNKPAITIPVAKTTASPLPVTNHTPVSGPVVSTHEPVISVNTVPSTILATKGAPSTSVPVSSTSTHPSPVTVPSAASTATPTLKKTARPKTSSTKASGVPQASQGRESPGKSSTVSKPSVTAPISETHTPKSVPDVAQNSIPPKELVGAPTLSTRDQGAVSVTPTATTMPIPTPPPEPSANPVKAGMTPSLQKTPEALDETATKPTPQTSEIKTPEPPPPPPSAEVEIPSGGRMADPVLPPPLSCVPEENAPAGMTPPHQPLESEAKEGDPDYVRESVTKRIKAFEKQASLEEIPTERPHAPARPVAPWVKKTSSGLVQHDTFWDMTSPEEQGDAPAVPPPPPPAQTQGERTRTMSPTKPPTQTKAIPAVPPSPPTVKFNQGPPKVIGPQVSARTHVSRPRPHTPRQRSISTGDYLANYIIPDDFLSPTKMPAEGGPNALATEANIPPSKPVLKDDALFDPWCDPKNPRIVTFQDVSAAAFKIKSGIMNTPCTRSHLSNITDMEVFFKKEFNQYTGSFKERGARYTLLMLSPEQRKKGVIAASAGNHALALSYHGQDLGIPVTVVMPLVAPIMKVQACRQHGANVIVKGKDIGECREHALKLSKEDGLLYINGYDHPQIIAGQGTLGLEIVEQVSNIDAVVIPVGGGGLIAGVALAVKALYPHVKVIGVESERCASFGAAVKAGKPVYVKAESTLADGLAVPMVGVNAFATASSLVDKVVTVKEEWIAISILRLVEGEKAVVEGAGATALAAILAGELPELKGKRVVIPLCGGNIDTTVLGRCLERGLAADGRLVKFTVTVSDRPGGIAELTRLLANLGVSIKDMVHERAWIRSDIFSVEVKVMAETRDYDHFIELKSALEHRYKRLRFAMPDLVHEDSTSYP